MIFYVFQAEKNDEMAEVPSSAIKFCFSSLYCH